MKKILLSLFALAVIGSTANVQAQCSGASVSITNFSAIPFTNSVFFKFDWTFVQGNASIEYTILCNGVAQSSYPCIPRLKDSVAGPHTVSGTFPIVCPGIITVRVRIWTNNSCGGNFCDTTRSTSQATLAANYKTFSATRNHSNVILKWETIWEQNTDGFSVERNTNGIWNQVAFVASQAPGGNSGALLSYQYADVNNIKGITQYRIRQVDFDNKSKYSEIRSVRGDGQIGKIIVYPNPTLDGKVNVSFEDVSVLRDVSLIDMSGRMIKQWKAVTNNQITIDNLTPGMYTLRVVVPETGEQTVEKIVVNKR